MDLPEIIIDERKEEYLENFLALYNSPNKEDRDLADSIINAEVERDPEFVSKLLDYCWKRANYYNQSLSSLRYIESYKLTEVLFNE